jgi:hypothetical protein
MPDPPRDLELPLRMTNTGDLAEVAQDSDREKAQCARAILASPVGLFTDLPDFGTPPQAHRQGGANLDELERCVHQWEPRIDTTTWRDSGRLQALSDDVTVGWKDAAHGG